MYEILILGGGASGLYAGFLLEEAGIKNYLILENNKKAGYKLSITGGGMANLTNKDISIDNYVGAEPEFVRNALSHFSYKKALHLFKKLDIPLEERDFGQIFSRISAKEIRDILAYPLAIEHECEILKVEDSKDKEYFCVRTSKGQYEARKIVLATGSIAYPQLNASDIGLKIAKYYNIEYKPFKPALTPFILQKSSKLLGLSGISIDVGIHLGKKEIIRPLLFTHSGLSGPAILLLSCYYNDLDMKINFLPKEDIKALCHDTAHGKLLLKNLLCRYMPDRLAFALLDENLQNKKVAELSKKEREYLSKTIHSYNLDDIVLDGFEKAEAAKNGILTKEIDNSTMQVKKRKNMYVIGEVLDILGHLGGYNLHFAFASASLCVHSIIKDLKIERDL